MSEMLGYLAALGAAISWALGSILFRRLGEKVTPLGLNLGKCLIGLVYLGAVLFFTGIEPVTLKIFLILGASGLLGIALGDTFFFEALIRLGPRLTLLLATLGPAFTVILAVLFLRERPSVLQWSGIILTLGGVITVVWERPSAADVRKGWAKGLIYSLLSIVCMSAGILLAKIGVAPVSALEGTFIRLLWGASGLFICGCVTRKFGNWLTPFRDPGLFRLMLVSVFVIIFGGFWLFLVSLKFIDASIATILEATTPLWILPMSFFILKEKIRMREVIGVTIAVCGVGCIFLR